MVTNSRYHVSQEEPSEPTLKPHKFTIPSLSTCYQRSLAGQPDGLFPNDESEMTIVTVERVSGYPSLVRDSFVRWMDALTLNSVGSVSLTNKFL